MNHRDALFLFFFCFASCNYKFLVYKRYVVEDEKGYLVFTQDEVNFFPTKDTVDNYFLGEKNKEKGYRIDFSTDWLDSLSTDYSFAAEMEPKKFSIIPVVVRSYLGNVWQEKSEQNTFSYLWEGKRQILRYKVYDFRSIIHISVVRESDRKRLKGISQQ